MVKTKCGYGEEVTVKDLNQTGILMLPRMRMFGPEPICNLRLLMRRETDEAEKHNPLETLQPLQRPEEGKL